ncbi:MAG: tRNA-dihydrouridine synthase, partial [Coleofasciculus sp. C2-GNP5-27]
IPALNYPRVFAVKQRFPQLNIVINGGIESLELARELLAVVDGVMLGRAAYQNPYLLNEVDSLFFDSKPSKRERLDYLDSYIPYIESQLARGTPLHHMTRHILGLFKGQAGGKLFRRHLSEHSHNQGAGIEVLLEAITYLN